MTTGSPETQHADRTAAETLIRSSALALANGAPVRDLDQLISRNAGRISHADILAGRLGSDVLGDIIGTVEQAKGNAAFNWSAATPEQIKAYLTTNGFAFADHGRQGLALSGSGRDPSPASGERSGADVRVSEVTQHNFAGTGYHAAGLSFDSFNAMRREGFSGTQIIAAVNTNKALGIGVNDNPAATARLQRDTPWAVDSLKESHDALKEASECDDKANQAEAKGDTAGAERWRKQAEAKRQQEAEHHRQTQDRLGREKPERRGDYDNRYQRMQDGLRSIKSGNDAEDKAMLNVIEDYRRHPDDAAARRRYEALNKKLSADPRKKQGMAEIDKTLHAGQKAEVAKIKTNYETASNIKVKANQRNAEEHDLNRTKTEIAAIDDEMAALIAKPIQVEHGSTERVHRETASKTEHASSSEPKGAKEKKVVEASAKPAAKKSAPALA
jgi:hypothetical protein